MNTRRTILGLATAFFVGLRAKAQTLKRAPVKEVARYELTGPQAGLEAILVDVTAVPGAPSIAHRHPGFVVGYVLDGEMQFAINGEAPRIVKTGATFFEPAGALHTTGSTAKPDRPVRFLAFMVVPKGSPPVVPAA
jgi:quercetin dioxygenase-like cupin family protein